MSYFCLEAHNDARKTMESERASAGKESERRVRVRGREGEEVEWSRKAARRAGRLNNWLNDLDPSEDTVFPINETATTVLRTLGAMCHDDDWSASRLDECSLTQLAALIEGASNLIAEQALVYAQTALRGDWMANVPTSCVSCSVRWTTLRAMRSACKPLQSRPSLRIVPCRSLPPRGHPRCP